MSFIHFEGKSLDRGCIGKVWRSGTSLFCFYGNKPLLLKQYEDPDWTRYVLRFLLHQLGRV